MERKCNIHYKIIPNYWILFSSKASYNRQSSKGKTKQEETQIKSLACYHLIICLNSLLSQLSHKFVSFGCCSHPFAHPSCTELWHGCGEGEDEHWGWPPDLGLTALSHQLVVPPTVPGHRHILQTLPAHGDWAPASQALALSGCGDAGMMSPALTRHPQGWGSAFSPQVTQEGSSRDRTELRGSHKHLCAALWADNSSSAKSSGCCKPASKESSVLWSLGRSTHTVPEASLQAIPSSLSFWICLGCIFV